MTCAIIPDNPYSSITTTVQVLVVVSAISDAKVIQLTQVINQLCIFVTLLIVVIVEVHGYFGGAFGVVGSSNRLLQALEPVNVPVIGNKKLLLSAVFKNAQLYGSNGGFR